MPGDDIINITVLLTRVNERVYLNHGVDVKLFARAACMGRDVAIA